MLPKVSTAYGYFQLEAKKGGEVTYKDFAKLSEQQKEAYAQKLKDEMLKTVRSIKRVLSSDAPVRFPGKYAAFEEFVINNSSLSRAEAFEKFNDDLEEQKKKKKKFEDVNVKIKKDKFLKLKQEYFDHNSAKKPPKHGYNLFIREFAKKNKTTSLEGFPAKAAEAWAKLIDSEKNEYVTRARNMQLIPVTPEEHLVSMMLTIKSHIGSSWSKSLHSRKRSGYVQFISDYLNKHADKEKMATQKMKDAAEAWGKLTPEQKKQYSK